MSNAKIGRYEIVSLIGQGGMAAVYQAFDPDQNRAVAIKILGQDYQNDLGFRARFEREAETIARLNHRAIVPLHEFGQHEGKLYIVMEYMPGGSLADRLLQGPLSIISAADVLARVGEALNYAHNLGVIHRDLKPSNILFDRDHNAFLADFGIALYATAASPDRVVLSGTPAYMSPEQARKEKDITGQSDLYSLGITLYESLTGKRPFGQDTPMATLIKRMQELPPSPRQFNPELPLALDSVFDKILSTDPNHRHQSGARFIQAFFKACDLQPPVEDQPETAGEAVVDKRILDEDLPTDSSHTISLDTGSPLPPETKIDSGANALETHPQRNLPANLWRRMGENPVLLLILVSLLGVLSAAVVVGLVRAPLLQNSPRSDATSEKGTAASNQPERSEQITPIVSVIAGVRKANALLVYTDESVTLINIAGSPLSVNDLLFMRTPGENELDPVQSTSLQVNLAESLGGDLAEGNCYQLLHLQDTQSGPLPNPILLPNCNVLQGWLTVDDKDWFFRPPDNTGNEFQIFQGDRLIQTCSLLDNRCEFYVSQP